MRFLLLGTLAVYTKTAVISVNGCKQAGLLGALLAADGRRVSGEELVDELWGDSPPTEPSSALRAQIARLRRKLKEWEPDGPGENRLSFHHPGYVLQVSGNDTDAGWFTREIANIRPLLTSEPRRSALLLREALRVWRGPVLDGLALGMTGMGLVRQLEELRLQTMQDLARVWLGLGEWAEAIVDLRQALVHEPFHEGLVGMLITALGRAGRKADALETYHRARTRFLDELGVDPGPELRRCVGAFLASNGVLRAPIQRKLARPETAVTVVEASRSPRERHMVAVGEVAGGPRPGGWDDASGSTAGSTDGGGAQYGSWNASAGAGQGPERSLTTPTLRTVPASSQNGCSPLGGHTSDAPRETPPATAPHPSRTPPQATAGMPPATTGTPRVVGPEGLTARGRIEVFADAGSFVEFGSLAQHHAHDFGIDRRRPAGDGVVTGLCRVNARPVAVFAQDPGDLGGSLGEVHAAKIRRIQEHALRARIPVVGILDSGGARIQEGVAALDGYASIFRATAQLSGRVPQISLVVGPCAGGASYAPALGDLVVMAGERSCMFLTGPRVVRQVTHENVTAVELGGPQVHTRQSGSAQLAVAGVDEAFQLVRKVLGYLPSSCWHEPPVIAPTPAWPMPMIPGNPRRAYDVQDVINGIVDAGSACVLHAQFGRNLVTAFARLDGAPVGVVANQPNALGGTLNVTAAEKGARFVRLCDAFGIPLLVLVDTPGFLPGRKEEAAGIIRKGAKLLYAFIEATVPRVTVILRKAYGGAYIVMNSKGIGADAVYAWPTAELGVMGAEGAVEIIHQRRLQRDPASRGDLIREYQQQVMPVERAAARLSVDEIIDPACTRETLSSVLRSLSGGIERTFRHDNQPQ